jgi:hypothetical protein
MAFYRLPCDAESRAAATSPSRADVIIFLRRGRGRGEGDSVPPRVNMIHIAITVEGYAAIESTR